jgi:hypothetical protein
MTSRGQNNGPSPLPFRNDLPSPEHVLERIRTLTGELGALQAEIYGQIADPEELLDRRAMLEQAGSAAVLLDFKAALDQVRSILWFCESGNTTTGDGSQSDHERDYARATELLNTMFPNRVVEQTGKESCSFFERLDRVIDNYMQAGVSSKAHAGRSKHS